MSALSRRRFLVGGAAAAVAAGGAGAVGVAAASGRAGDDDVVSFHGAHQAGIVTPAQDRLHLAAFDVTTSSRAELVELLRVWTAAAAAMTAGREVGDSGATGGPYAAPPEDTGEALGLRPARLTVTFGFGPTLFADASGADRFGLAARRPAALAALPPFPADALDPARSGGDLCVQACADDPQVAVHAVRNLARLGFGAARVRWSQLGFGRTSSTSDAQRTPRNLFGFKDGTANLTAEEPGELDRFVWVQPGDDAAAPWLAGGSYLVVRRIAMRVETWDRTSLAEQEAVIGRDKREGAPLSGGDEHAAPDFAAAGRTGPLVPVDSHVALAHPSANGGSRILRRGYNYVDGTDRVGHLDAGLAFLAYTRDPGRHLVPMLASLARRDRLNEYVRHTSSAVFAVPPGVAGPGEHVGAALFA